MSRHRNVRSMNIADEYEGYDDIYGHSVEEDFCVSPATAAQFMYNRDGAHDLAAFIREPEIPEEDEGDHWSDHEPMNDSGRFVRPTLNETDQARLNSCLEEMHNVLGESQAEHVMIGAIIDNQYNCERALDSLLAHGEMPKPQREPRTNRRSRNMETATSTNATNIPILDPVPTPAVKHKTPSIVDAVLVDDGGAADLAPGPVPGPAPGLARMTFSSGDYVPRERGFRMADGAEVNGTRALDTNTLQVDSAGSRRAGSPAKMDDAMKRASSPAKMNDAMKRASSPAKMDDAMKRASSPAKSDDTLGDACYTPSRRSKQTERVDVLREVEKRKEGKDHINMVVIGHVDAGKSTLMGHLLFQLGVVSQRSMHKNEQESKKQGKASFAYAWVLDETEEERSRGVTMDIAKTWFSTVSKSVTLLDAPGHKDFIPNMITGAAQADVAVLVVNATRGEFETGFEAGGQTREHALLVRSLGVSQLVVAVNKMDTVDWSQERYDEIVKKLGTFLKQAGFRESDVSYVPCSGITGENLTKLTVPELQWYTGKSLLEQIDSFRPAERLVEKAFRMCVSDVYKGLGSGFCINGRVEAGSVQITDRLLVMPASQSATVKSIQQEEEAIQCAIAGDYITLTITGIDMDRLTLGSILCDPNMPIYACTRIIARVVTFNIDVPLTKGFPVVFHYQTMSEPAVIHKLVSLLHKTTGEVVKKRPRCLGKNCNAVIELTLSRPVCVELYKDYKNLGRFMLRYGGSTIGAGLVTKLKEVKS